MRKPFVLAVFVVVTTVAFVVSLCAAETSFTQDDRDRFIRLERKVE